MAQEGEKRRIKKRENREGTRGKCDKRRRRWGEKISQCKGEKMHRSSHSWFCRERTQVKKERRVKRENECK